MIDGLSNTFINKILSRKCMLYKGVFSANNIDIVLSKLSDFSIVCNLSNFAEKGSHWITIIAKSNFVIYIDPFGLSCINATIRNFLTDCKRPVFYNTKTIQSPSSNFCGMYAIMYCLYFDQDRKFNLYFDCENILGNDELCLLYINKMI